MAERSAANILVPHSHSTSSKRGSGFETRERNPIIPIPVGGESHVGRPCRNALLSTLANPISPSPLQQTPIITTSSSYPAKTFHSLTTSILCQSYLCTSRRSRRQGLVSSVRPARWRWGVGGGGYGFCFEFGW